MTTHPGSGTQSTLFALSDTTEEVKVLPYTITQPMQIARYFIDDVREFLRKTGIDLIHYLGIENEPSYPGDLAEIVNFLYDDIAHLIRDGLIAAINILVSDKDPDPHLGMYVLRYHATYLIGSPVRPLRPEQAQRFGGYLDPPARIWQDNNFRFDLLIDWNPGTSPQQRRRAVRPEYLFDWVTEQSSFDGSTLLHYRSGGMTMDGAQLVSREEAARAPDLGQ
ncbi:MAG TPA: hypothetical protein VGF67_19345 [Ktedonobacteraceae bacterium]|jgi:hypothetical protein